MDIFLYPIEEVPTDIYISDSSDLCVGGVKYLPILGVGD